MKFTKKFGFKIFIIYFVLIFCSLGIFTVFLTSKLSDDLTDRTYNDIEYYTSLLKREVDHYMEDVEKDVFKLAKFDYIQNKNAQIFDTVSQLVIDESSFISQIYIMDKNGDQVYKSSFIETMGNRSDRKYFKEAIKGNNYFSDVIVSRSTELPIVVHSQPIYRDDDIIGVIGVSIDLSFLNSIAIKSHIGTTSENEYGFIVDSNGILLGHPNLEFVAEGLDISELEPVKKVNSGDAGVGVYTFRGVEKLVAYSPSSKTNWGILFQRPKKEALKDVKEIETLLLYTSIIVLMISIIVIIFLVKILKKPIDKIVNMIKEISENGDYGNVEIEENEFGIIQNELIRMAKKVKISHERLEELVDERTIELESTKDELILANEKLKLLSFSDGLTNIPNRRSLDEYIKFSWSGFKRNKISSAFFMIDIDNFKAFNDTKGHQAGDVCLIAVAKKLNELLLRESDFLARYGGEEFMVIIQDVDYEGVILMADRLCKGIENMHYEHGAFSETPWITVSIGVGYIDEYENETPKELIEFADNNMYKAKKQGKNRFVIDKYKIL